MTSVAASVQDFENRNPAANLKGFPTTYSPLSRPRFLCYASRAKHRDIVGKCGAIFTPERACSTGHATGSRANSGRPRIGALNAYHAVATARQQAFEPPSKRLGLIGRWTGSR
ncbi:hypothetical protein [Shimia ponticola]|uniref:hypothetical protein n=1 Tax=Shimia ponticola TaxID=2582893 RepID=UPI00164B2520|nr:hypothetical protein [Shimia ponticola]